MNKIYGDSDSTFTYNVNGLVGEDSLSGELSRQEGENVGNYGIILGTLTAGQNYIIDFVGANFKINQKIIDVYPDTLSKIYGQADPLFTYSSSALIDGDAFTGVLNREAGENAGEYNITIGTLSAGGNYNIDFNASLFTILPKHIAVNAIALSKTYGQNDPILEYTYNSSDLVGADSFSGALNRVEGENVGSYDILIGTLTVGTNYIIDFTSAIFKINVKNIRVNAVFCSKIYGETDPEFTYQYNAEDLLEGNFFSGSLTRKLGENVGYYPLYVGTLSAGGNYYIDFESDNLQIKVKDIEICANSHSKIYGNNDGELTYSYNKEDLVNGDSFSGYLNRAVGENVGSYEINKGTLTLGNNYNIIFTIGTFTISPLQIVVTNFVLENERTYDGTNVAEIISFDTNIINDEVALIVSAKFNTKNITANLINVEFTLTNNIYGNYIVPQNYTISEGVKINRKLIDIVGITAINRQYNATFDVILSGGVLVGVIGTEDVKFNLGVGRIAESDIGEYSVGTQIIITGADKDNYSFSQPDYITVQISPKEVDVIWICNTDYIYNGSDQSETIKAYYTDVFSAQIWLDVSFDKTFKNADVYNITASMLTIDGNYKLLDTTKQITIEKLQIEVYDFVINTDKVYDATDVCKILSWTSNIVDSTVILEIKAFFNSANTDASSVSIEFTLINDEFNNYIIPENYTLEDTVKITPLNVEVVWNHSEEYTYDSTDQSGTVTAHITDINGDTVALNVDFDKDFINAGQYTVTALWVIADDNYALTNNIVNLQINALKIVVSGLTVTKQKVFDANDVAKISDFTTNIINGEVSLSIYANYNVSDVTANCINVTHVLTMILRRLLCWLNNLISQLCLYHQKPFVLSPLNR